MFANITAKAKALLLRINDYWRSDASTIHGAISVAIGFFSDENARALHTLGLPEDLIAKIGAVLILAGAILVTPKMRP